jgi:hypothetical protein
MRVRMLEASELPTKEYLQTLKTSRSSKIPISVGRLPERLLSSINQNGEKKLSCEMTNLLQLRHRKKQRKTGLTRIDIRYSRV